MRIPLAVLALCAALPVVAQSGLSQCERDPAARGLIQRIENIRDQMGRIELTTNADEQRRLLTLHAKTMQEAMQEVRRRAPDSACRDELLAAMMEQMLRHQVALQDTP